MKFKNQIADLNEDSSGLKRQIQENIEQRDLDFTREMQLYEVMTSIISFSISLILIYKLIIFERFLL